MYVQSVSKYTFFFLSLVLPPAHPIYIQYETLVYRNQVEDYVVQSRATTILCVMCTGAHVLCKQKSGVELYIMYKRAEIFILKTRTAPSI
ncbi:hypothetical protein B0H16DRAFT_1619115 [Mycena metata]|uniref:Secreted protein n=1 Tax=Mycena metata TaxID=1033252 RepID=A0AAD7H7B5_9AGAR|nr:hypothetical protein B0H16DRAFT_1619115 [Mycena metata]